MSQLAANSQFGAYKIMRTIGGGGMAQIYLAKTSGLAGFEKLLALKVINAEYANEKRFIQMLIDEAKIAVGLSHVNIAQVFDLGQFNGIYYIAMEYVDGCDVLALVNGLHGLSRNVPIDAVAYVARQMAAGLHYAHTRKDRSGSPLNIVHRDISPQNILVSRAGEVKVVDFGIAKAAGVSTRTQAGVIKGKVNYMAPEQASGHQVDNRTDVFAMGIVIWEMLTSQMAYNADNVAQLLSAVRKAAIPPPSTVRPEIMPELDQIVMKALARKPEKRYQNAHELQVDLTKYLSNNAPEYGGSNLAALVDKVLTKKEYREAPSLNGQHLSKEDQLQDNCSLIFEPDEAGPQPARLLVKNDADQDEIHALGDELIIGRAGQLAVPDARVSRQHARIIRDGENFILEDLGSSNGTYLNDQRIQGTVPLSHGDRIRVGSFKMRFMTASTPAAAPEVIPIPKITITFGDQKSEQLLDTELTLTYRISIGPFQLEGNSGRIVRKEDEVWVEPKQGRAPIMFHGQQATKPLLLNRGDSLELAGMTITYTN